MGWAWADHDTSPEDGSEHRHDGDCDAGGATNGTNQIGELCAVLEALRAHPGSEDLVIETDSQYAINCSTKWVRGWKKNGWKNSQKKPVKNAPLIKAIDAELFRRPGSVRFKWVKGHAGNFGNEKVDDLAHTYSGDARSGVKDGYLPLEGWQSLLASDYAKGVDIPADAQMLLDGRISSKEYHLGRGVASSADDDENPGDHGSNVDRHESGRVAVPRRKPSLEGLLAERAGTPNTPPRIQKAAASSSDAKEPGIAASGTIANAVQNRARGTDTTGDDWCGTDTDSDDLSASGSLNAAPGADAKGTSISDDSDTSENDREGADASDDDSEKNDADMQMSDDDEEKSPAANAETPALQQAVSGDTSGSSKTSQPGRPTGLTLSGTLRFSPPPSSSATYDGRPRFIRGAVAIEGYVEGDGTIMLSDAPFAVNM
jgi:ribonuclease HI